MGTRKVMDMFHGHVFRMFHDDSHSILVVLMGILISTGDVTISLWHRAIKHLFPATTMTEPQTGRFERTDGD